MSQNEFDDCIIVGGGLGGLTAGIYAMRAALKTVCIERGVPGGRVAITKGRVFLVHRRDAFRASRILQQRVMAEPKIEILFNTVVTEIQSDENGVRAVSLKDTQTGAQRKLATEGVFIFAGFSPNDQIVPVGVKVNSSGYAITDEKCETSIPGIFAIGDLRQKYANQIVIAAADGCTAALAAAYFVEMRKGSALSFATISSVSASSA